jgi:hypothetical protein
VDALQEVAEVFDSVACVVWRDSLFAFLAELRSAGSALGGFDDGGFEGLVFSPKFLDLRKQN